MLHSAGGATIKHKIYDYGCEESFWFLFFKGVRSCVVWSHMDKITHIQLHFSWEQNRVSGSKAYFSTFGPAMSVKFIVRICAVIGSGIKKVQQGLTMFVRAEIT